MTLYTYILGTIATSNIDYVSKNINATVSFTSDTYEFCQTATISNDLVAERTEYFNVALHSRSGSELASCQVAIIDRNGGKQRISLLTVVYFTNLPIYFIPGPPDCYEKAVSNISLGQIVNDRA